MSAMGARTASGLVHSHNSDLDMRIPRPKQPKRALPDCLRRKAPRRKSQVEEGGSASIGAENEPSIYSAGAGVLDPRGAKGGEYRAGSQRNFLKRGTGGGHGYMSERASRLKQLQNGPGVSRGVYTCESYLKSGTSSAKEAGSLQASLDEKAKARRRSMQARKALALKPTGQLIAGRHGKFGRCSF